MAAKREQILWKPIWPIAKRLEDSFSLKGICSVGVILFDRLSAEDQKKLIADIKHSRLPVEPSQASEKEFRKRVLNIINETQIDQLWTNIEKIAKKVGVKLKK